MKAIISKYLSLKKIMKPHYLQYCQILKKKTKKTQNKIKAIIYKRNHIKIYYIQKLKTQYNL